MSLNELTHFFAIYLTNICCIGKYSISFILLFSSVQKSMKNPLPIIVLLEREQHFNQLKINASRHLRVKSRNEEGEEEKRGERGEEGRGAGAGDNRSKGEIDLRV